MYHASKLLFVAALVAGCSGQVVVDDVGATGDTSDTQSLPPNSDSQDTSGTQTPTGSDDGTASGSGTSFDTSTLVDSSTSGSDTSDGIDADSDGWMDKWDCDDHDSAVSPGQQEVAGNGKDDNCNGETDEQSSTDSDTGDPYPGSVDTHFNVGSLIIPMDLDYQDRGMLKAYGLVYQLLLAEVKVYWLIKTPKAASAVDFVASAQDVATGAEIVDHGYRGGPFAIAASDVPVALEVIEEWQASNVTTVHQATSEFVGPVARVLRQVPRIAILATGKEDISFAYMNAAGIPDSLNQKWPAKVDGTGAYSAYPDVLSVADVRGPSDTDNMDGALFDGSGNPVYCELMTMHWDVKDRDEAAIAEIRQYLHSHVHFFAECQSVNAVENAANGRFLTPNGYIMDDQPSSVDILAPYLPFAQIDGPFQTVGGSEPSYSLPDGDHYYDDGVVMVTEAGSPIGTRDVWMTGYLDGACKINDIIPTMLGRGLAPPPGVDCPGKISYLGGHKYNTATPISQNPDSQGTRFFLNALFEADCITANP